VISIRATVPTGAAALVLAPDIDAATSERLRTAESDVDARAFREAIRRRT
jgi:hypothetical protein